MSKKNKEARRIRILPVERHSTAAWAGKKTEKLASKVLIPGQLDVELAREWVNQNQK